MECSRVIRVTLRRTLPLAAFLEDDGVLAGLAADCGLEPVEFIASEFVPEVEAGEQYRDWLVRQVRAVLETRVMSDGHRQLPDGSLHKASRIVQAEMNATDRRWIEDTFANRTGVQNAWADAHVKVWARAA